MPERIDLSRTTAQSARPGWFYWDEADAVIVRCPRCRREQEIKDNHEIRDDGFVHPSVGCYTVGGCSWHVYINLMNYDLPARKGTR